MRDKKRTRLEEEKMFIEREKRLLKKSFVNTRQLFAIMRWQWRQRWGRQQQR